MQPSSKLLPEQFQQYNLTNIINLQNTIWQLIIAKRITFKTAHSRQTFPFLFYRI